MKRDLLLVLGMAVLEWFNAGVVWLAQYSGYPLWPYVGAAGFPGFYHVWRLGFWGVLAPGLVLAATGAVLLLWRHSERVPRWACWTGCALQGAVMTWAGLRLLPLEEQAAALGGRSDSAAYEELLSANWVLIALVTVYAALALWILVRTLWEGPMERGQLVLLVSSALGLYGAGNMVLVQFLCYRLWPSIGRGEAYAYHVAWWHSIWGVLFIPAGVVVLGSLALIWIRPQGISRRDGWTGFSLQMAIYVVTGAWFAPLMARLATPEGGLSLPLYHLMMNTHWVRFALVMAYGVVCCLLLVRSARRSEVFELSRTRG
jgi:hypothetical protein